MRGKMDKDVLELQNKHVGLTSAPADTCKFITIVPLNRRYNDIGLLRTAGKLNIYHIWSKQQRKDLSVQPSNKILFKK